MRLDCTFIALFVFGVCNSGIHYTVHVNDDKRVLNEDKCTMAMCFACMSCHEEILQNYFRCNLSCHVMLCPYCDSCFKIILLQYFQFSAK